MRWFGRSRKKAERSAAASTHPGRRFQFLGGRRFVADAPYMLPKDDAEINRLDFQHYMLRHVLRGLYAAPIGTPSAVLDVGCGTGRWPSEMAQAFPQANVIGLDIVLPPAEEGRAALPRPANYTFVPGNVLEGLPFADASFDFVHQRLLVGAIPAARWPDVVRELVRVTRPGGWIQLIEPAPVPGGGPALAKLRGWMVEATRRRGIDLLLVEHIADLLQQVGLASVNGQTLNIPIGRYGGRIGVMAETNYVSLLTSLRALMLAQNLTDAATFDETLRAATAELTLGKYVSPYFVAWGQRGV
jgi:ubiquinone/menaquinone biosynthesis C-methylase UbiE